MAESNYVSPWSRDSHAGADTQRDASPWRDVLVVFSDGSRRFVPRESVRIKMERVTVLDLPTPGRVAVTTAEEDER